MPHRRNYTLTMAVTVAMSYKLKILQRKPPKGWEDLEPTLEKFEEKMKEAIDDPMEGKRRAESTWMITRLHWEKNRFIYESYYEEKTISKKMYEYLCQMKIADGPLIAKWRKPGYEYLCALSAIDTRNTNYGTASICRVPIHQRPEKPTPAQSTGCISCASCDKGAPIWWNTKFNAKRPLEEPEEEELDPDVAERLKRLKEMA